VRSQGQDNELGGDDIYIGVDDTDSIKGMCTTYLATELIKDFGELDLIGNPRLVRLNPNVPWKTRGNAAVGLRFGKGRGKPKKIGVIDSVPVNCYQTGYTTQPDDELFERACKVLENLAVFDDENTNPGIVMTAKKPRAGLYWEAVRRLADLDEHLSKAKVDYARGYKNKRGLIGAISAIAWHPRDRTYELIAYREKDKWGTPRDIDTESVKHMDKKIKTTFNNYDHEEAHLAIAPNSPCPILYGIRGDVETDLHKASKIVKSENMARWLIYLTNQGTDDHISNASISNLEPYTSVKVRGVVSRAPRKITGGHLIFSLTNGTHTMDCTIYEPAKGFRKVGTALVPGDRLTVYGGVRERPFTINVEKIFIESLTKAEKKVANPMCGKCKKRMKSLGKNQGYRCIGCGKKAPETEAEHAAVERTIKPGWHEPPVGSRRHLSKPLKRVR